MRRVSRSDSRITSARKRWRSAGSRSGLSCRISEKARIEVSGVRSSCVTVEMKSSLSRSSSFRRSLAALSSWVAASQLLLLLLEPVAVGDHLGRLVDDGHHLLEAQGLLLRDRGHHRPRRGRPDRAGELQLREAHEVAVALELVDALHPAQARVGGEELHGPRGPEEAAHQRLQRRGRRARPRQDEPGSPGLLVDVHEERRLRVLGRALAPDDRADHVGADVGDHAPDHRMGDRVEARQAEELRGPQELDAPRARARRTPSPSQPDLAKAGSSSV